MANKSDEQTTPAVADVPKKGKGLPGPKQRCWLCYAERGNNPVVDVIPWPPPQIDAEGKVLKTFAPRSNEESERECARIFKERHKLNAKMIYGPVYEVKDKPADKPRVGISVSAKDLMRFTGKNYRGVFKGWVVYGTGMKAVQVGSKKFADNELVRPVLDTLADPNNKIPRPRLKANEAILRSDLQDCKEISD